MSLARISRTAATLVATLAVTPAVLAAPPAELRLRPQLPTFDMHTYNNGYGERVVQVRRGGLAWRLGLEPGDTIVRLNRYPLRYHGAWQDALGAAINRGGTVRLAIRDVHSGRLAWRHVDLRTNGYRPDEYHLPAPDPICEAPPVYDPSLPSSPITPRVLSPRDRVRVPAPSFDRGQPTAAWPQGSSRMSSLLAGLLSGRP